MMGRGLTPCATWCLLARAAFRRAHAFCGSQFCQNPPVVMSASPRFSANSLRVFSALGLLNRFMSLRSWFGQAEEIARGIGNVGDREFPADEARWTSDIGEGDGAFE